MSMPVEEIASLGQALLEPVADGDPCGPELDLEGDPAFMNYLAQVEGQLPAEASSDFDPKKIDVAAVMSEGRALLDRSRDIRIVVVLAKLAILNRDLGGFAQGLRALRALLVERWDEVHPRGADDDFLFRMAPLYTLDDMPVVVVPLQYAPLIARSREGPVTFRMHQIASGDIKGRENEST